MPVNLVNKNKNSNIEITLVNKGRDLSQKITEKWYQARNTMHNFHRYNIDMKIVTMKRAILNDFPRILSKATCYEFSISNKKFAIMLHKRLAG